MRMRFLWAGAYFVAAVLVLTPLMDVSLAAFPFRPGDMTWRFATIGIFAEGVMLALVGLYLALGLAVYLEHPGVLKVLGIVSALGCFAFLAVIAVFLVEAPEMRALVPPEAQTGMMVASAGALLKHTTGLIGMGLMALAARSELRRAGRSRKR